MSFEITCPYCFEKFNDSEVNFRSELITRGDCEYIPEDYTDIQDFITRYQGADKEEIIAKYNDWEFFNESDDEKYKKFWTHSGEGGGGTVFDTTEKNPVDEREGITSYRRRIIDPSNAEHWQYLKGGDPESSIGYDDDGMVESVELRTGDKCYKRVCPYCHNPLPLEYGKHPTKFVSVIGVTGAGKTVYLSQLVKNLENYAAKVGLTAIVGGVSAATFLHNNTVKEGTPLPGATPPKQFQQPLFYDMVSTNAGKKQVHTFVMYDIAGETCTESESILKFGPFIAHSNGILLLVDPIQFKVIRDQLSNTEDNKAAAMPTAVLQAIHHYVANGKADEKCNIPIAVCISKSDEDKIQDVLDADLGDSILSNVEALRDDRGHGITQFNATDFNPIAKGLQSFIADPDNEAALDMMLYNNYSCYNYFAFSSLGCGLREDKTPEGPILPKRIEESLLWLFNKFGFIGENEPIVSFGEPDVFCPNCGEHRAVDKLPEKERLRVERSFLKKKEYIDTYICSDCGYRW